MQLFSANLQALLQEAENGKFPENDLLLQLKTVIHEGEVCLKVAQQLVSTKRPRTRWASLSNVVVGLNSSLRVTCVLV